MVVILGATLVLVGPARAQAPIIRPSLTIAPATATVGDRLTLTISVEHADGTTITGAPTAGSDFGGLDVVDVAAAVTTRPQPGLQRTTFTYTLAAFRTGTFTVPSFTLGWRGDQTPGGTLGTPAGTVTIESVLPPGDTALRPLQPQLSIADPAPRPVVPVIFVAAFALLTGGSYVLLARTLAIPPPARGALSPAAPGARPEVRARAALDALAAGGVGERDPAEYYARIAAIVRGYLSERYGFAAFAMTHSELERGMAATEIDRWPARVAAGLLEQCEAVEFAGFRPAAERRAADLAAAYEVIALTGSAAGHHAVSSAEHRAPLS
ncbi:MAG TPA: BatD family protein [Dehalococcoidia bacterium]|nr:BatD family protein [Dehalococcoidia bacterium]